MLLLPRDFFGMNFTLPRGRALHAEAMPSGCTRGWGGGGGWGGFVYLPALSWEGTAHDGTVSAAFSDEPSAPVGSQRAETKAGSVFRIKEAAVEPVGYTGWGLHQQCFRRRVSCVEEKDNRGSQPQPC